MQLIVVMRPIVKEMPLHRISTNTITIRIIRGSAGAKRTIVAAGNLNQTCTTIGSTQTHNNNSSSSTQRARTTTTGFTSNLFRRTMSTTTIAITSGAGTSHRSSNEVAQAITTPIKLTTTINTSSHSFSRNNHSSKLNTQDTQHN